MSKSDHTPDWAEIKRKVTSRAYFMAGALLEAIEQDPYVSRQREEVGRGFFRNLDAEMVMNSAFLEQPFYRLSALLSF
jgi:hypothetical protein